MLDIINFSENYGKSKNVVENITIHVEPGDIYGFIGHNGAGKTTTIKAVVGILDIKQGDILIDGISMKENPLECKKKIAYVPDNPDIYDTMSGINYLNFIADVYEVSKEERQAKIEQFAKMFGLEDVLGNYISSYSHGMKQKLILISALLHSPKLLILDEPFVGLDPKASFDLKEIMKDLCRQGCAIFFSTHVLEVAEKLCNKIAIIKEGHIVVDGKMEEVRGNSSLEDVFLELVNHE